MTPLAARSGPSRVVAPSIRAAAPAPHVDYVVALVLAGMLRFPEALAAARALGEDLFLPGPCRVVATLMVTGREPDMRWLTGAEKAMVRATLDQIARLDIPHTAEWALSLIRFQAERRHQALLASSLRWAADRAEEGHRFSHLRRHTTHAFDVAEGNVPLDPHHPWEPRP